MHWARSYNTDNSSAVQGIKPATLPQRENQGIASLEIRCFPLATKAEYLFWVFSKPASTCATHTHTHTHVRACMHIHTHTHARAHAHAHAHTRARTRAHARAHTRTRARAHTHTHTNTHTNTHKHTHTHTQVRVGVLPNNNSRHVDQGD